MQLRRVQVVGGFLDGLDLEFVPGLNVLVGARGTGKTSIIELIRFCLGSPGLTTESLDRGHQQAISVLGDGVITITVDDGSSTAQISRSAREELAAGAMALEAPTVLAQSEIETVGSQASGRLALVDRMIPNAADTASAVRRISSELESQTAEVQSLVRQMSGLEEQLETLAEVPQQLKEASERQRAVLANVQATEADRERLSGLQAEMSVIAVRGSVLKQAEEDVRKIVDRLQITVSAGRAIVEWPSSAGPDDLLGPIRVRVSGALDDVARAAVTVGDALKDIASLNSLNQSQRAETEQVARELRSSLEELQQGLGETTRTVDRLQELEGQRSALVSRLSELNARKAAVVARRRSSYAELERVRTDRFETRTSISEGLTAELRPAIEVRVVRSAMTDGYSSAIAAALRGSGLHYNTWAPLISEAMPPIELVEAVESGDAEAIVDAAAIPADRAGAIVQQLRDSNLSNLIAVPVDDGVVLSLLDGMTWKTSDELSIGQRCTAVLPVLLSPSGQTLLIDQPEDHLDNAFISDTLVETLRRRTLADQLIFSSHNANIPVLGEADQVIVLGSDGRRGFALHQAPLDDPKIVASIMSLLEGGDLAFKKRAAFYESITESSSGEE